MNTTLEYSDEYYELLARIMGEEQAAWARLPPAEREKELRWYHDNFDTPDDLALWPPELDGGLYNGFSSGRGQIRPDNPARKRIENLPDCQTNE
jgi:hypothetical protein